MTVVVGSSTFKMSTGIAAPVSPRNRVSAEVRYVRTVMAPSGGGGCEVGEEGMLGDVLWLERLGWEMG